MVTFTSSGTHQVPNRVRAVYSRGPTHGCRFRLILHQVDLRNLTGLFLVSRETLSQDVFCVGRIGNIRFNSLRRRVDSKSIEVIKFKCFAGVARACFC